MMLVATFNHMDSPTQTATIIPFHKHGGNQPGYRNPYEQAIDWQRTLNEHRGKPTVEMVRLASGAKAFVALEYLKRNIKMQPNPRQCDVQPLLKRGNNNTLHHVSSSEDPDPPAPTKRQQPASSPACCQPAAAAAAPTPTPPDPAPQT
jgi:hypothetical protein